MPQGPRWNREESPDFVGGPNKTPSTSERSTYKGGFCYGLFGRTRQPHESTFNRGPYGLVVLHKPVRFPPGLSRRDHNWLATKAEQDISLSVGPVPAGATIQLARTWPASRAPAGTGPTESHECCEKVFRSVLV